MKFVEIGSPHHRPHFHAYHQDDVAIFGIDPIDLKRDVIRRGGENVSSVLVEKTLREHPAVAEVAVIGVPDPVLGQEIKAYVVAKDPVTGP